MIGDWLPLPAPTDRMIIVRIHQGSTAQAVPAFAHHYRDGVVRYRRPNVCPDDHGAWYLGEVDAWVDFPAPGAAAAELADRPRRPFQGTVLYR